MKSIFFNPSVIVVALGYFVDIFDLTLFGMVRRQSLKDIGITEDRLVDLGIMLLNAQMIGMLCGGILWGQWGDRKGRMTTLFGSIILYSLANLGNAFVQDFFWYFILRFIAGIGLAGELGVGITLVSELLPKEQRGLGTAWVATIGVLGAVLGGFFVEVFPWRICYAVGGLLGLLLLFLRLKVHESHLFKKTHEKTDIVRGSFLYFFRHRRLTRLFLLCTLCGVPIWYVAGLLMPFTPELARELGVDGEILASRSIAISYLGLALGDFLSGILSQLLKSRRLSMMIFQICAWAGVAILFFSAKGSGQVYFYTLCFLIGVGAGFWALFVTVAAENFGTNIRATAATSIPNFVRASVTPMSALLNLFKPIFPFWMANFFVGCIVFTLAIWAAYSLPETFAKDLDYEDTHLT